MDNDFYEYLKKNNASIVINEILQYRKYEYLFKMDKILVNEYFIKLCESEDNLSAIKKLLKLCCWLNYQNAIIICMNYDNKQVFNAIIKANTKLIIEKKLITKAAKLKDDYYIITMLNNSLISCSDVFITCCKYNIIELALKIIASVNRDFLLKLFKDMYVNNYMHELLPYIYVVISNDCDLFGILDFPCKNAELLLLFKYELFYTFETQLNYIINEYDYRSLELLLKIMPEKNTIDYEIIQPLIQKMPNTLLNELMPKITPGTFNNEARMQTLEWEILP